MNQNVTSECFARLDAGAVHQQGQYAVVHIYGRASSAPRRPNSILQTVKRGVTLLSIFALSETPWLSSLSLSISWSQLPSPWGAGTVNYISLIFSYNWTLRILRAVSGKQRGFERLGLDFTTPRITLKEKRNITPYSKAHMTTVWPSRFVKEFCWQTGRSLLQCNAWSISLMDW